MKNHNKTGMLLFSNARTNGLIQILKGRDMQVLRANLKHSAAKLSYLSFYNKQMSSMHNYYPMLIAYCLTFKKKKNKLVSKKGHFHTFPLK